MLIAKGIQNIVRPCIYLSDIRPKLAPCALLLEIASQNVKLVLEQPGIKILKMLRLEIILGVLEFL